MKLYIIIGLLLLLAIPTFGIALLLLIFAKRFYYSIVKSGIVFVVKEGVSIYMFSDRKLIRRVVEIHRGYCESRDERRRLLGG